MIAVNRSTTRKGLLASLFIILYSLWLFSSGDVFYLDADPIAVDALPGHEITINLSRPRYATQGKLVVRLESLDPEVAEVSPDVVIPNGETSVKVAVRPRRPGPANFRASAELYGDVIFTLNVLDRPDANEAVAPSSIHLRLAKDQSATVPVSADLPPDAISDSVDLVFAVDGRPTFGNTAARLAAAFPGLVSKLKARFPSVKFTFAVTKFQDYGGPGQIFWRLAPPRPEFQVSRPFALLAPTTPADTSAQIEALAAAIGATIPGSGVIVGSYFEALGQIAQGAGFDGDANGSKTDSGLAAVAGGGSSPGFLAPGISGDVPPFSSKPASITAAGPFGGVGFRASAQRLVLLATNTLPVSPLDRAKPFPETVTGANGVTLPIAFFQDIELTPPQGTVFPNQRLGPISASATLADPANSVAPKGAFTLPEIFKLLGEQKIQVMTLFQLSEPGPEGGIVDPEISLNSVSRLTNAFDAQRSPLTFEVLGDAEAVSTRMVAALVPPLTLPVRVSLRAVGNDAGFGFSFTPESVVAGPGQKVEFSVTITGTGGPGTFEIQFVTETGVIVGRIPVFINLDKPEITTVVPSSATCGGQVTITGTNFSASVNDVTVTIGGVTAQIVSTSLTSITAIIPPTAVAGPNNVVVTVGGLASAPVVMTVLHKITSLAPTSGPAGTVYTIQGCGFAPSLTGNSVTFGTATATVTEATNGQLRGAVPSNLEAGLYPVRVTTNGVTTDAGTFDLLPQASSITPNRGPGGTAFTIAGTGFSPTVANNTLTFADKNSPKTAAATLTSATFTELKGTVPPDLIAGEHTVTITVNGRTASPLTFTVTPFITSVTPSVVAIGGQLSISGTGFSPVLSENVVTLNGKQVPLDSGSSPAVLLVTVAPGVSGTSLAVVVTTRGIASNTVTVAINPSPVILTQTFIVSGQPKTFPGVTAIFERRDNLVITVSGADPNGDVVTCTIMIRDGEGQVLGNLNVDVASILANQIQFVFRAPLSESNHFTAAMKAIVQLKDAAGNGSNTWTADVILQPPPGSFSPALESAPPGALEPPSLLLGVRQRWPSDTMPPDSPRGSARQ